MSTTNLIPPRAKLPQREWPTLAMLATSLLYLALAGCATWQAPAEFDDDALRARADIQTVRGVTLRAAVLSSDDSQKIFAANVNQTNVQPVWIEVENSTKQVLWMLRAGTDPDLFSPLEVAWSFHSLFASETNERLDKHFASLSFQNPISPGTKRSGILFTNPHDMSRLLSIDILGQGEVFPFTLFLPVPDDQTAESTTFLANVKQLIAAVTVDVQGTDMFRARLQQLPCCAMIAEGSEVGEPINIIMVGNFANVASALVRRGFRQDVLDFDKSLWLFGRPADVVVRKKGQAGVPANWLRMWVAPFSYQGKTVFLAQAGRRQGWRLQEVEQKDMVLHPDVDEARNLLIQDMLYSNGLEKLAFVSGVGTTAAGESRRSPGGASYHTDGLRAVLFLVARPLSLSDLEILDWHPYRKLTETDAVKELGNVGQ